MLSGFSTLRNKYLQVFKIFLLKILDKYSKRGSKRALLIVNSELYSKEHRATIKSQSRNKSHNLGVASAPNHLLSKFKSGAISRARIRFLSQALLELSKIFSNDFKNYKNLLRYFKFTQIC